MQLNKGLNTDLDKAQIPEGFWASARNIVYTPKGIENEYGFDLSFDLSDGAYSASDYTGFKIIGKIEYLNGVVLFSTNNTTSEIGTFDGTTYVRVLRDIPTASLSFSTSHLIEGVYKFNNLSELVITWTDNYNKPKSLNLNDLPFSVDSNNIFNDADINKLLYFTELSPNFTLPTLTIAESNFYTYYKDGTIPEELLAMPGIIGGEPLMITIALRYKIVNSYTNWYYFPNIASVPDIKSIEINLAGTDSNYDYFQLAVIYYDKGEIYTKLLNDTTNTTSGDFTLILKNLEDYVLDDVLIPNIILERFKTLTILNKRLLIANVNTDIEFNYQKYANNIKSRWVTKTTTYITDDIHTCFMIDEVYSLYITWIFKNGSESRAFHIPGREAVSDELLDVTVANGFTATEESLGVKKFHIKDTSGSSPNILSYWENAGERYPTATIGLEDVEIWEEDPSALGTGRQKISGTRTIAGEQVRHHKIPSFNKLGVSGRIDKCFGIELEDVFVPDDMKDLVQGYYISIGDRSKQKTVLGYSWFQPSNLNRSITDNSSEPNTIRLHDKNLMIEQPVLTIDFLKLMYVASLGTSLFIDTPTSTIDTIAASNYVYAYRPRNNDIVNNKGRDATLALEITDLVTSYLPAFTDDDDYTNDNYGVGLICSIRKDIYNNYSNQNLIPISDSFIKLVVGSPYDTGDLFGADTLFEGNSQYLIFKELGGTSGFSQRFSYPTLRYKTLLEIDIVKEVEAIAVDEAAGEPTTTSNNRNYFAYSNLYTALHTLKSNIINVFGRTYTIERPYTIYKSAVQQEESTIDNWKTILSTNYYELTKTTGEITKLVSINKDLIIQTVDTTYKAIIKDVLKTSTVDAYLGTGDLFDRDPDRLAIIGKLGNQNQFGTVLINKGLVFCDSSTGEVFILGSSINKLNGYVNTLLNTFTKNTTDLPYTGLGIIMGYDFKNERILLTSKEDSSYTISFSLNESGIGIDNWTSLHDYIPDMYITIADELYSIKNFTNKPQIYKHNVETKVGTFYKANDGVGTQEVFKSYVDPILNLNSPVSKKYSSVQWSSIRYLLSTKAQQQNATITSILIYNNTQSTGEILLKGNETTDRLLNSILSPNQGLYKNSYGIWSFDLLRDAIIHKRALTDVILDDSNFINIDGTLNEDVFKFNSVTLDKSYYNKAHLLDGFIAMRLIYDNIIQSKVIITKVDALAQPNI